MNDTPRTPLQRVLREQDIRQYRLAALVGVTEAHISRIANGLHPTEDMKGRIARALGREIAELWPTDEPDRVAA
jgi:transcriptional regulator with XRE-family HTH domain